MTSKRTFYRTFVLLDIISEQPLQPDTPLNDVEFPVSSHEAAYVPSEAITAKDAASLMTRRGSLTRMFGLTPDGEDV